MYAKICNCKNLLVTIQHYNFLFWLLALIFPLLPIGNMFIYFFFLFSYINILPVPCTHCTTTCLQSNTFYFTTVGKKRIKIINVCKWLLAYYIGTYPVYYLLTRRPKKNSNNILLVDIPHLLLILYFNFIYFLCLPCQSHC